MIKDEIRESGDGDGDVGGEEWEKDKEEGKQQDLGRHYLPNGHCNTQARIRGKT